MIKRNKDKDIQARLTEYICDIILLFEKIKNGIGNWFKSREHLKKQTDKNIRGIFKANNTPKSFTGCNYTYIRLDFLHGDPKKLFEICLKNIPTSKDLSDISFKEYSRRLMLLLYSIIGRSMTSPISFFTVFST